MKKRIAIIGFGSVGQTVLKQVDQNSEFANRFEIHAIWNRSYNVFEDKGIPSGIILYRDIEDLIADLDKVDLVIECAHSSVLIEYGVKILALA